MGFPQKFGANAVPTSVRTLVSELLPQLVEGDHPALAALRAQVQRATITEVEMTGVGFYVDFSTPQDVPLAEPPDFAGGDAEIVLKGAQHPAGCVVFVRGGRLATFEGYTYADEWPVAAEVVEVKNVSPVIPGAAERQGVRRT